jgi:hypothetical protein
MPHSAGNAKSPVSVRVKKCKAVHLEMECESIAVGHPKHQVVLELHILAIQRGKEGKGMHLLVFHLLHRGKQIIHCLELCFLLICVVWVKDALVPSWSFGSTVLYVMGGSMYPVD